MKNMLSPNAGNNPLAKEVGAPNSATKKVGVPNNTPKKNAGPNNMDSPASSYK